MTYDTLRFRLQRAVYLLHSRRPQSGHGWRRSRPLLGTDHGAICLHCCSLYTTSTPSASSAQWGKARSTSLVSDASNHRSLTRIQHLQSSSHISPSIGTVLVSQARQTLYKIPSHWLAFSRFVRNPSSSHVVVTALHFQYSQMGCATSTKLRVPPWLRLSPPTIVPPVPHGVGVVHPNSELLSAATVP
ncbi:hypothetical protein IAQ61_011612 [Plenodomus lingam]|uniref:uncharacterized protein n=1 Tax=Leptosphaeria maculans TaxID=5022 RepID=UPI00332C517F|nr:hypothetical protein IAQ61_011612 [Plenodomus lingam]